MHGPRLRPATDDDHGAFARLFLDLETGDAVPDRARFAAQMAADTRILEVDGETAGYVYTQILEGTGYVRHLVVDRGARRRGLGRLVMDDAATRFRAAGCSRWCLNVKPDNTAARRLYASCGMEQVHAAQVVRLVWGDEERLPPAAVTARAIVEDEDHAFEDAYGVPRGLLAAGRATGKVALGARGDEGPLGLASFDPLFPGAFPFRAADPGVARALVDACRARRAPLVDPYHRWRERGYQVVVEADEALTAALVAVGGVVVLETLHYAGAL